jgi:hypothetical protein
MGVLSFKVGSRERVDEIYADLVAAGYWGQQPPYYAFWGARYAVIEDPDGLSWAKLIIMGHCVAQPWGMKTGSAGCGTHGLGFLVFGQRRTGREVHGGWCAARRRR